MSGAHGRVPPGHQDGFAVSANYTYRKSKDFTWNQFEKTRGAGDYYTTADYVLAGKRTGKLPDRPPPHPPRRTEKRACGEQCVLIASVRYTALPLTSECRSAPWPRPSRPTIPSCAAISAR